MEALNDLVKRKGPPKFKFDEVEENPEALKKFREAVSMMESDFPQSKKLNKYYSQLCTVEEITQIGGPPYEEGASLTNAYITREKNAKIDD
jgi:hypothetical protein